jgi:DNA-binding transcriptional LysR family regulator
MDRLQAMKVFERVVVENGFAAAGRKLDLLPSTVTRLVAELEEYLGVRLLQRSTRRLALTAVGASYLDRVRSILSDIADAEEAAHSQSREMSGSIRVLALRGMATHLVAPAIAEFRRRHPKVTIELHSDGPAPGDIEDHDITLVTDQVPLPGEIVVRPVVRCDSVFCASPDYVRRHGAPRAPQDLLEHAMVRIVVPGVPYGPLRVLHETDEGREEEVGVSPVFTCDDHEAALRGTLEGAGISSLTMQVAAPMLLSGRLQRVLTPWLSDRFTLMAGFSSRRHVPVRTRAFLDHLIRHAARGAGGTDAGVVDVLQ